jgi:hypothetical protein
MSTRVAADAANGGDDDGDDDVVLRIPVFLRPSDPRAPVCLFQYPLRPRWRPYHLDEVESARVRPDQRRVELTLGNECAAAHFDDTSPSPLTSLSLASTCTAAKTSYAIGMLRTDEVGTPVSLCLTPLSSTVQLRPSFALLDQVDGDSSAKTTPRSTGRSAAGDEAMTDSSLHGADVSEGAAEEDADGEGAGGSDGGSGQPLTSVLAPLFRPAQTEREMEARKSSHAYLVEQREAEPWSPATLHPPDSPRSLEVRERCFGVAR